MAEEIAGYVSTGTGFCLEFSEFAPGWILVQTILFIVATSLAVFDTYSDWVVVLNFQKFGLNNPLLPDDPNWLRAWYFFSTVGTVITAVAFFNDLVDLLYPMFISCKRHCCKPCIKMAKPEVHANSIELRNEEEMNGEKKEEDDVDDDEIADPCRCCFHCGCNVNTRNETLSSLALWFQDIPLSSLALLFGVVQYTCLTPDVSDRKEVSDLLRDIGISLLAAMLSGTYRFIRSIFRLWASFAVRVKKCCCQRLVPKKRNAPYPPDTPAQFLLCPYYLGISFQLIIVNYLVLGPIIIWVYYILSIVHPPDISNSVGIYRLNLDSTETRLFNITGNIIPVNGSFVNVEVVDTGLAEIREIYCLSEFEYRPSEFQIFFNAVQLVVISFEGKFCVNYSGNGNETLNKCEFYYTGDDTLFYAFGLPGSILNSRFDETCILSNNFVYSFSTDPAVDFNIRVDERINTTGFPRNGEDIQVYYPPPIDIFLNIIFLLGQPSQIFTTTFTFQNSTSGENTTCSLLQIQPRRKCPIQLQRRVQHDGR